MKKTILVLLFLLPIFLSAQNIIVQSSQNLKGRIIRVSDGDTVILIDNDSTQHKIVLYEIDAPEYDQPYGNEAKDYLSSLIANKNVSVTVVRRDQYKRLLGVIYLEDRNINLEMMCSGYVWKSKDSNSIFHTKLQEKVKKAKKGLWADENAIEPWQWRKEKGR